MASNGLFRSSLSWSLAALVAIAASVATADDALFEASIRPVLVNTCFRCHGGERV
jgi:cytochrome c553